MLEYTETYATEVEVLGGGVQTLLHSSKFLFISVEGGGGPLVLVRGIQGVIEGVGLNNSGSSNHSDTHHSTFLVHTPLLSPQ